MNTMNAKDLKRKPVTPAEIAQRNIDLDDLERSLLFLLRNPPQSPVSRLWERDLRERASTFGYEFADRPMIGRECRPGIDRGIVYGGDMVDAF